MRTHDHIPEFVVAYLQGEATAEQTLAASEWLKVAENLEVYRQLEKLNSLTADLQAMGKFDVRQAKQKVLKKYRNQKWLVIANWTQRIAAVLFIPVLLAGIWYYLQQNELRKNLTSLLVNQEIVTQPGTKTHLFLPDSTEVWLNASSSLRFPSVFAGDERRIKLDGEAYFKVFKNKSKPFIVETSHLEVEALGTAFNLSAYSGDSKISTTLEEGKVKIAGGANAKKVAYLDPGGQLNYFPENKDYETLQVKVEDVIAWKDGILIFNQTPFYEVVAKLGRWFNAEMHITDPSIANYRFTGTFTSESLEQVMELLTLTTPIGYSNTRKEKMPDNASYPKQIIRIWKK